MNWRLVITVAVRLLTVAAGFGAVAVGAFGLDESWLTASLAVGIVTFGLAAVPGFELVSGVAIVALFATVVLRIYRLDSSVSRALVIGLLALVWALLMQLAEMIWNESPSRPVMVPLVVWARESWQLLVVGTAAGVLAAAGASVSVEIGGNVAIALAIVAPAILLMAVVFAWRWRDPGNQPAPMIDQNRR